jgi:hypothetical protein
VLRSPLRLDKARMPREIYLGLFSADQARHTDTDPVLIERSMPIGSMSHCLEGAVSHYQGAEALNGEIQESWDHLAAELPAQHGGWEIPAARG